MTTHSMEEVDALASRVGIIASKMLGERIEICTTRVWLRHSLAVGTPASLKSRFATYEIHLAASHVARTLGYLQVNGFKGAHQSLDTLTRISVPGVREDDLGGLLDALARAQEELGLEELTIHE